MKPSEILKLHRKEILQIIAVNHGTNPRVFGSVARGEDTEYSDLDILIDPTPQMKFLDAGLMMEDLRDLLKIHVDVVPTNYLRDDFFPFVMKDAKPI